MEEPILKMKNITKTFPGVLALNSLSFDVRKGEVHALLGENGAGKSTLMKIISGVYPKDEGQMFYKGKEILVQNPLAAQKLGINIIYQEFNLFPQLTVAQNIFIGREPRTGVKGILDEKRLIENTREILDSLALDIKPTQVVSDLSVARQQMVEIAKAISFNAEILIMDEPTSALTESEIVQLFRIIKDLSSRQVGIVYISHRLQELEELADRVTVIRDGEWVGTVNFSDTTPATLISMMVGRDIKDMFPKRKPKIGENLLEIEDISREGHLDNIGFKVKKGEILGIAGLMGAGRSELARAIFGADKADSSQLKFEGKKVKIKSPRDAIKLGIGYLTENRKKDGLALSLDVEENTILASIRDFCNGIGIINKKKCVKTTKDLVKSLKIKTPSLHQKVMNLSGGNQQKIIIAKWLCKHSKLLIFDEPTRGIDVGAKVEVYELMNKLADSGVGIIMISSELPEILGMSDRILVMREGRIAGEILKTEATQEKIMALATGSL